MKIYGLIGYPLDHSWSKNYFEQKFANLGLTDHQYHLFPLPLVKDLVHLVRNTPQLMGLNVTIPFKQSVLKYLQSLDKAAEEIGAVNCIRIHRQGEDPILMGYNTDVFGFESSIKPMLKPLHSKALILGTGGSAKAVSWVLQKLGIGHLFVSRRPHDCNQVSYGFLEPSVLREYHLIINATPMGMYPDTGVAPALPYEALTPEHLLFDLVYNPVETEFLKIGKQYGAQTVSGLEMLHIQADKSWEIWSA